MKQSAFTKSQKAGTKLRINQAMLANTAEFDIQHRFDDGFIIIWM